jgi:type IV pilus assembly protein PilY1
MDTDQDGLADRMYVGDMGGQLWRFDIINSTTDNEVAADNLVRGGVIASLGAKDLVSNKDKNARRFYNAPDVTAMQNQGGRQYFNIAIGSGWRGKPTKNDVDDRFYAIRDYLPFRAMTEDEYDDVNDDPLSDSDLIDITDDVSPNLAANAVGWKLRLGTGEKVLSDSTTFDNRVFFTTFTPSASSNGSTCIANSTGGGTNRAYIVNVADGSPVMNMRDSEGSGDEEEDGNGSDDGLTADDRSTDLRQGGIAAGVTFLFPEPNKLVCLSGVEVLGACSNFNSRVKTYWREEGAN